MIGQLRGILLSKEPPHLLLDAHGVGYEIEAPLSTFYDLPAPGSEITLYTHLVVREDAHLLFGFANAQERTLFRTLLKVNGVGARLALTILSGVSAQGFVRCVQNNDSASLTRLPGIGKKTAERLLLELKGRPVFARAVAGSAAAAPSDDVRQALLALGYNEREAAEAIRQLPADLGVGEAIRQALRVLSKT